MQVRKVSEVEAQEVGAEAPGVVKQVLIGPEEGARNFVLRRFDVEPGGNTPRHFHEWEHEVYVLAGEGELICDDGILKLGPDCVVFVPGGEEHQFRNPGDCTLSFLCIIPAQ